MANIIRFFRARIRTPLLAALILTSFMKSAHCQQPGEPYRIETTAMAPASGENSLSQLPPIQQFPSNAPAVSPWAAPAAQQFSSEGTDPNRIRLATFPRDATEPLLDQPNNFVLIPESQQPNLPPQRAGMFQRISATTTYLPRFDENNSVGFEDTEIYGVFGVPCPTRDSPLLIEPGTDFWVVDAPNFNLPPTVHDDYVEFHWLAKLNDCWGADLMVTPGWHSDYQNANGSQAFRLESHAVASMQTSFPRAESFGLLTQTLVSNSSPPNRALLIASIAVPPSSAGPTSPANSAAANGPLSKLRALITS
jgi:hypothetical protein